MPECYFYWWMSWGWVPYPTRGPPEARTKPGACPRGRVFRSAGGSQNFLGSSLHSESPPAAAFSPPTWQRGGSATSVSSWLCPERSCPHPGCRETHSSHSVGRTPYVAIATAEMASLPKQGMESCLGRQYRIVPHIRSLWRWQVVLAKPQPAHWSWHSQGQRFLGTLWCCKHTWPWSCTRDRVHPAPCCLHMVPNPTSSDALSVLAHQVMSDGCRDREVFSFLCIWLGSAPFLSLLLGPILVFSSFLLFFFSPLKGLSKAVPTGPHQWAPPGLPLSLLPLSSSLFVLPCWRSRPVTFGNREWLVVIYRLTPK